jgi:L-seryl-tRNA(Ser) seleniumtransferase
MKKSPALRAIPAVEKVLQALGPLDLPRPVVTQTVRSELAAVRKEKTIPDPDAILARIRAAVGRLANARLQPVINATGVLIHTNLGRAPLAAEAVEALCSVAANYNNLEFDLSTGQRGSRALYLEQNLALLCGAEAATVANNCAAALVLILRHFTSGDRKEVIISRGELVQIGGGFRIPEILEASGARLREVGATNKTSVSDYTKAIGRNTALILKVHRSNFFMGGFVESPATEELAALAKKKRIPLVEDLGSGAVAATEKLAAIDHEPTPGEILKRGVDLVCFSGDKLLGGPQAGLIAGKAKLIAALKREPFFRALRCDKLVLSALEATVDLYLSGHASERIPALAMLGATTDQLRARAEQIVGGLGNLPMELQIGDAKSQIGGGTLPRSSVPSITIDLQVPGEPVAATAARLRAARPPVIGYVDSDWLRLDLRSVFPEQDQPLADAIRSLASGAR